MEVDISRARMISWHESNASRIASMRQIKQTVTFSPLRLAKNSKRKKKKSQIRTTVLLRIKKNSASRQGLPHMHHQYLSILSWTGLHRLTSRIYLWLVKNRSPTPLHMLHSKKILQLAWDLHLYIRYILEKKNYNSCWHNTNIRINYNT
jgi:hypothetical protein